MWNSNSFHNPDGWISFGLGVIEACIGMDLLSPMNIVAACFPCLSECCFSQGNSLLEKFQLSISQQLVLQPESISSSM